ncbi:MAG: AI-2E family transporter [Candidatus Binataceae bacterium]
MERERIVHLFFFGFLALMTFALYEVLAPFLAPIAWAILLAFLVHPLFLWLCRVIRNRTAAAVVLTFAVTLLIIIPSLWLLCHLTHEARTLYTALTQFLKQGGAGERHRAGQWLLATRLGQATGRMLARHGLKLEDEITSLLITAAKIASDYIVSHASYIARNIIGAVIGFGVMLVTLFYLLRDGSGWYYTLRDLTPLYDEDKAAVFETLRATLASVMRGLMVAALMQGVLIGAGYFVCGVSYWAVLAIATAACGLLPIGGTALVWLPVSIYIAVNAGWPWAAGLIVWSSLAAAVIDNFVKPLTMRHGTGLPTLALFFGIAGGLSVFGPLGIFAGPAIIAVFAALIRVYRKTYGGDETRPIRIAR